MNLTINPSESTILKFEIDVEGSSAQPMPRLVIPINESGISMLFEGKLENGEVTVDISELLKLTNSLQFKGKLEVVVEDNIFVPWEENIIITKPTTVKAKSVTSSIKESKVTVEAKTNLTEKQKQPDNVMKLNKKTAKQMFFGE